LTLRFVFLAEPKDHPNDFRVEAASLGFRHHFFHIPGNRILFLLKALQALDERAKSVGSNAATVFGSCFKCRRIWHLRP
jgi:hypothetical protein